jgi:hypothetical protein
LAHLTESDLKTKAKTNDVPLLGMEAWKIFGQSVSSWRRLLSLTPGGGHAVVSLTQLQSNLCSFRGGVCNNYGNKTSNKSLRAQLLRPHPSRAIYDHIPNKKYSTAS